MKNKTFITVLLLLVLTFCSYYGYESGFFYTTKSVIKHSINFGLLIAIAVAGYLGLKQYKKEWTKRLWIYVYAIVIIFLTCFGLFDSLYRIGNYNIRHFIANIRMFFTSPLPFSILIFLSRSDKKVIPTAEKEKFVSNQDDKLK